MTQHLSSRHTPSFPAFLHQAGVSLAVSTYQAGRLILLRGGEVLNTHFVFLEKPMGIAARGPRLTVGTDHRVLDWFNLPAVAAKLSPPERHDACYLPRRRHITGDIDIHELAFDGEGDLWLVNTRMSCLCTLDLEYSVVPRWRPPFVSGLDLGDRCHLNGLAMRDGRPTYITALGETDTAQGWRGNKASGGVLMALDGDRVVRRGLSMPHSPRWYDGRLWLLESGAGRLCVVDPDSGDMEVIVELPGFTRGLDFVGPYALVGLSQVRETAVFAGLPLTKRCAERHCGVWIVDTVRRVVVGQVVFDGGVQEIFAVQALPWRYPALLESSDPLVRVSYSLPDEALKDFARPDPIELRLEQSTLKHREGQLEAAIDGYREVLKQDPEHLTAHYRLGVALSDAERWREAIGHLEAVMRRQPDHADAHNALGHAWSGLGDWQRALGCYQRAIAVDQAYAKAHFNRGLILLRQGHYAEGWEEYEWRWKMDEFTPFSCPQPQWQGEAIDAKTLLVHTEQGNGDAIQFARFLPLAARRCRRLVLVCPEPLRVLLAGVEGVDETRLPGELPVDSFDLYCPILSLPRVLNITLEDLPGQVPYLRVPPPVVVPDLPHTGRPRVGLVWAGHHGHKRDRHRSCPAEQFLGLAQTSGCDFYSLQRPMDAPMREQLRAHGVTDLEPELVSYAHTAALVRQLDLVVGVDTSVVHLAGALDVPTCVLLERHADWRWLDGREDSPWYPAARLFRQQRLDDWAGLLETVRSALQSLPCKP